jgi:lipopolysaccharide exporter
MSINREIAKSGTWTVTMRLANRGIGFFSTMILARLLVPADFGLVGTAMIFVSLVELVNAYSLHIYLVQKKDLADEDLNTAWTFQAMICTFQAGLLMALGVPISRFFDSSNLLPIIFALAGSVLIAGFKNIGVMYFQRDMRFQIEFILVNGSKLFSFLVTVGLAFLLKNYWALVVGIVANRGAELILSYILHPYRPKFHLSAFRKLIGFSKWIYFDNLLIFLGQRGPESIISKAAGQEIFGLFSVSYDIAMLPTSEMIAPINRAVFPGYVKMNKVDSVELQKGYLNVLNVIALIAIPAAVGIAVTADVLIPLLLGVKWLPAVPMIQVLAIAGGFASLSSNAGAVFLSKGRPWVLTWISALRVGILLPAVWIFLVEMGPAGAAMAYLLTSAVMCIVWFLIIIRVLNLNLRTIAYQLYRPLIAVTAMYFAVRFVVFLLMPVDGTLQNILVAAVMILTGFVAFVVVDGFLWLFAGRPVAAEKRIIDLIQGILTNFMAKRKTIVTKT